jgi:phasin family protein
MFTPDQFIAAQKSNVETLYGLTQKAFEGVEKLVALNLQASKAALEEATDAALSVKDPQQLFVPQGDLLQPAADKATAYGREVYEIVAQVNAEVSKFAEDTVAQVRKEWLAAIDSAVKNAPSGSETAASLFKAGVVAANDAFDGVQRIAKQASEAVEANVVALTPKAAKAGKASPASKAKRAA